MIPLSRTEKYRLGLASGRRLAEHRPDINCEPALRLQLSHLQSRYNPHRPFALGELRGYRQAAGLPNHIREA